MNTPLDLQANPSPLKRGTNAERIFLNEHGHWILDVVSECL